MELAPPENPDQGGPTFAGPADGPRPSRPAIEAALARILASREFMTSPRLQALLRYLVAATLDGQGDRLKGYAIAVDVFDRSDTFDPRIDSIVRVQAGRLRKQLAAYYKRVGAADPVRIDFPTGGYAADFCFAGSDLPPAPATSVAEPPDAPPILLSPAAAEKPAAGVSTGRRSWVMFGAVAFATLALLAMVMMSIPRGRDPAVAMPAGPTIFVARYELIDGPGYGRQLRDGLQYELIDRLSRFPELSILGIDTVYGADATAASRQPRGAAFILTGSVQAAGSSLRVTSRLLRTSDNTIVWSQVFDGPLADASGVFDIQSRIASDVAAQLGQPYGVIQEKLTLDPAAEKSVAMEDYLCVLQGYEYSRAKSAESHERVRACLEAVTARSPRYAPAWAKLSWMYGDEVRFNYNRRAEGPPPFERARLAAEKAVGASPQSAMAHQYLAIALFHLGDDDGFHREAEQALSLNPNNSEILADMGQYFVLLDGSERGRDLVQKAIDLNPGHPAWYYQGLAAYALMHREKEPALRNALLFYEEGGPMATYLLAGAYRLNGKGDKADATLAALEAQGSDALKDRPAMLKRLRLPASLAPLIFGKSAG